MAVQLGQFTIIGEHEEDVGGATVRLLPFPWDAHFYPWWSETTRAVLEALPALTGQTVIDFGCGASAILALAAARLGAVHVWAVDEQKTLCETAERQVAANGLAGVVEVVAGTAPPATADFMLANVGDALLVGQVSTWAAHGIGTDRDGGLIQW